MGYYIQTDGPKDKVQSLMALEGTSIAIDIEKGKGLGSVPEDKALVCVVDNGPFEAAALVYSEEEFTDFSLPDDLRPKQWLLMDKTTAHELAGYTA